MLGCQDREEKDDVWQAGEERLNRVLSSQGGTGGGGKYAEWAGQG